MHRSGIVTLAWLMLLFWPAFGRGEDEAARFMSMTPEEIRAYELDLMRRVADLALIPPRLNTAPLPQYDYDKLDYGMTIGIERTPQGRLWACWVAGGDSPKAFFVLAVSDDDGETWSKPCLVIDSHSANLPMDRAVIIGNLWTDPLGRLWLFFDQTMNHFDGRAGVWATICSNPDDAQPQWSPPRRIWHGSMLNKPIVLSSGEWVLPIYLNQFPGFGPFRDVFRELDPLRGAHMFVSTDNGESWERRGGPVKFPNPDWIEHMFVERRDGTLWMLARTKSGIMQATSADRGRSWSQPTDLSGVGHPNARFFIRRLASGRILLVKHGDTLGAHQGRVKLSAWLTEDEGQTWQGGLVLDDRASVSYPDGFQAPDGTIYVSYDRNRATDGEILMARFTEEDVLARRLVGAKSRLAILISRPLGKQKSKR
ncbi:MAG: exo-alpha-sialidase [Thermogutta sp.]|nr:exo-alpha-sialidase [Thermogutta sp.]